MESNILTTVVTTLHEAVQEGVKAIHSIKNGTTNFDNLKIIGRAELAEEVLGKMTGEKITLLQDTRDSYN